MADQARILGEALQTGTINAHLAQLPTFSDDLKTDKLTAKEWLQQVVNNKRGGTWTDPASNAFIFLIPCYSQISMQYFAILTGKLGTF